MKKIFALLLVILLALNLIACGGGGGGGGASENVNTPPDNIPYDGIAPQFLHYTLPDQYDYLNRGLPVADERAALFSAYTPTDGILYKDGINYVSGYALDQFVDKDEVNAATPDPDELLGTNDARKLYSVVVRSNQDGFTNRTKFVSQGLYNYDIRWDQYILGYLLDLYYSGRTYFPDFKIDLPNMYDNKYAYDIYMFRKIDVKRPDAEGSLVTFEPQATSERYVNDASYTLATSLTTTKFNVATKSFGEYSDVKVISLDQFLTDYITNTPGSYTYRIVGLDGSVRQGWTYAEMQQAYYLLDYDLIVRVDSSDNIVSGTKLNFPVRIEVISGSTVEYDYSAKNPPAFAVSN